MNNDKEMTYEVAVFDYVSGALIGVHTVSKLSNYDSYSDVIRISETVKITFKPRNTDEIVPEIIGKIDAEIEDLKQDFLDKKAKLETKKSDLLALTFDGDKK